MQYAEIIFLLVSFVVLLLVVLYFTKHKVSHKNSNMQLMEVLPLNFNQYVYIIRVGNEFHLFCGGKEGMAYGGQLGREGLSFEDNLAFSKVFDKSKIKWQKECKKDG